MRYIRQRKNDSYCAVISLLNAKRYYGFSTPTYGDEEFDVLMELAKAKSGPAINVLGAARCLGLDIKSVSRTSAHRHFPFSFACWPPNAGLHNVLAIGGSEKCWTVVNYRSHKGPTVETIPVEKFNFLPIPEGTEDQVFRQFRHIFIA